MIEIVALKRDLSISSEKEDDSIQSNFLVFLSLIGETQQLLL